VGEAEARAAHLEKSRPRFLEALGQTPPGPSMIGALRSGAVTVIAEVKRRSPSKGAIDESLDAVDQARAYAGGGAAAVSILTEPTHFGGTVDDLRAVRAALAIPLLKKDFHVQPIQLLEARAIGAAAALLIVRALAPAQLDDLMAYGRVLGLELLVEIRGEHELDRALRAGATMIGVNNRDLESLRIDAGTAERLIPLVPAEVVAIAESGVRARSDVERYAACGADAVLVGSVLSGAADPAGATRELTGVPRRSRGG
jgi:indole-3-glycerol phosphate synthase